jgi:hypothetical protein
VTHANIKSESENTNERIAISMFPAVRAAVKSCATPRVLARVSQRTVRAPRVGRNFSADAKVDDFDLKPYAAGFFAGALMFGAGRYISIVNSPKEEVTLLVASAWKDNKSFLRSYIIS